MNCVDENMIMDFIRGQLAEPKAAEVEKHLDACSDCRAVLALTMKTSQTASTQMNKKPAKQESQAPKAGEILGGRFRVVRPLGSGGFGVVLEAQDLQLEQRVALKLLRPDVQSSPALLQTLYHEIVIGRKISHPNVCRVYDLGSSGDLYFISMEYVEGESLESRLARGLIPQAQAADILRQICDALEAAHSQDVVHRDLKPSNIMLDEQGRVKVMDFGLARDLQSEISHSRSLVGTPAYWSPEQALVGKATQRSDIYALGVIGCKMFGVNRTLLDDDASFKAIPISFRKVFQKCLKLRPEARYASVQEVRTALGQALLHTRRSKTRRVEFGLLAATAAGALTLALLFWFTDLFNSPATQPEAAAPVPLAATGASEVPATPVAVKTEAPPAVLPEGGAPSTGALSGAIANIQPDVAAKTTAETKADETAKKPPAASPKNRRAKKPKAANKQPDLVPEQTPDPVVGNKVATVADVDPVSKSEPSNQDDPTSLAQAAQLAKQQGEVRQRILELEAKRQKRGMLLEDVPDYWRQVQWIQKALSDGSLASPDPALMELEKALDGCILDEKFVAQKLERLSKLYRGRNLGSQQEKQIKEVFNKVHASYFSGNFTQANQHLNEIWRLIQDAKL